MTLVKGVIQLHYQEFSDHYISIRCSGWDLEGEGPWTRALFTVFRILVYIHLKFSWSEGTKHPRSEWFKPDTSWNTCSVSPIAKLMTANMVVAKHDIQKQVW